MFLGLFFFVCLCTSSSRRHGDVGRVRARFQLADREHGTPASRQGRRTDAGRRRRRRRAARVAGVYRRRLVGRLVVVGQPQAPAGGVQGLRPGQRRLQRLHQSLRQSSQAQT